MKNKKFTACVAGVAVLANIVMFTAVNATSDTEASQQVTAGTRTIVSYDQTVTFNSTSVSFSDATTYATYENGIEWMDLNGNQAYALNPSITSNFSDSIDGDTFTMGGLSLSGDMEGVITIDGDCSAASIDTTLQSFSADDGTRAGSDVISFTDNPGVSRCRITPTLELVVPADTAAGTYRTTLSWTLS